MNRYTPPKYNTPTVVICAMLFVCAGVALCFSALGIGYRLVMQLVAVAAMVAGIQLTSRYVLCSYTYQIEKTEDAEYPVLSVLKKQSGIAGGADFRTVCSVSMGTAIDLTEKKPVGQLEAKYGRISKGFNYTANLFPIKNSAKAAPTKHYAYIFEFNGSTSVLYLEFEAAYCEYLAGLIKDINTTEQVYDPEKEN